MAFKKTISDKAKSAEKGKISDKKSQLALEATKVNEPIKASADLVALALIFRPLEIIPSNVFALIPN